MNDQKLMGTLMIIGKKNSIIPNKDFLFAFAGITANAFERKNAEIALKKSEEIYRLITEKIADVVWLMDLNGKSTFVSPSIEQFTGFTPEEYLEQTIETRFTHESALKGKQLFTEQIQQFSHKPEKLKDYHIILELEYLCKNGGTKWGELLITPYFNEDRKLAGIHGVTRDITERNHARKDIIESEEKFRNLVETTNDIIWETNTNGFYTYVSPQVENILGYRQNEFIGHSPFEFMPHEEAKKIKKRSDEIVTSKKPFDGLININLHKSGQQVIFETSGVPIIDADNNLLGYRGIDRDITYRKHVEEELIKAKEQAEKSERLKSVFLANMSHEIRTPMNSLIGYSDFLTEGNITETEQKEYAAIINKNSHRLLHLINSIIDISKIEAGEMQIQFGSFNINKLIKDIYDLNRNLSKNKKINFNYSLGMSDEKAVIKSSEIPIFQIITNFLSNAFKYTDSGEINFGYTLRPFDPSTGSGLRAQGTGVEPAELEFFVKDTGSGISKDYIPKIFSRFSQENPMLNRKFEGAGLGLSIAKGFADLLKGSIYINSEPEKGSIFYLKIPFESGDIQKTNENTIIIDKNFIDLSQATILIAEDDEAGFKLLKKQILRETKIKILHATDGFITLDYVKSEIDITCVLMDLHLPIMDGFTTTRNIKQINKKLPVIAVTAAVMTIDQEKALEAGCDAFFSKPIDIKKLVSLIAKYYVDT